MAKYADKKEISCIIANLFERLDLPCEDCYNNKDQIVITGETFNGYRATIYIEEDGVFLY